GSLFVIDCLPRNRTQLYDYADIYLAQCMMIRIKNIVLYAVFNDSSGVGHYFSQKVEKFSGPVNEVQSREILAELAFLNDHIAERPVFHSQFDLINCQHTILATRPKTLDLKPLDYKIKGELLTLVLANVMDKIRLKSTLQLNQLEAVRSGRITFL